MPPVAIIGNSSPINFLISLTSSGVCGPPDTFKISAPASIFPTTSSLNPVTVAITGMSTNSEIAFMSLFGIGEFTTTP